MPDLFDFFKENESKLHERPSEQVWQKLEKKLEKTRRPKRRSIRFLQLGVVALVLLLLILVAVLVWYFSKPKQHSEDRLHPRLEQFSWIQGTWEWEQELRASTRFPLDDKMRFIWKKNGSALSGKFIANRSVYEYEISVGSNDSVYCSKYLLEGSYLNKWGARKFLIAAPMVFLDSTTVVFEKNSESQGNRIYFSRRDDTLQVQSDHYMEGRIWGGNSSSDNFIFYRI